MDNAAQQAKELIKLEDGVTGLVVGANVYDPLLFSPDIVKFSAKQYVFLRSYRLGVSLEDAALKSGLTKDEAERFLDKPKTKAWLEDRATKDHIKNEWAEPGKWFKEGDDIIEGKKNWSKAQLEVWKAFGERVAPVKKEETHNTKPTIQINIDPSAVQEAFRRQQSIEAEIVREQSA